MHLDLTGLKQKIHFIGIGGIGMSGLAKILLQKSFQVSGSDKQKNSLTKELTALGAQIYSGHKAGFIAKADLIVKSSAIKADNPELLAAEQNKIPVISRGELLAQLMATKTGIAVAGAHGKTTTTSLLASIFLQAKQNPSFAIGGELAEVNTNAQAGAGKYFIAEADESDASFLLLNPEISIVTNIDAEHMATYDYDLDKLHAAYLDFINNSPVNGLAVLCIDDPVIKSLLPKVNIPVLTYGESDIADLQLINYQQNKLRTKFTINISGNIEQFELNLPGKYNVLNAIAAIAVALHCQLDLLDIKSALANFQGVGRRMQNYGKLDFDGRKVTLLDDYGHHPKEISVALNCLQEAYPDRQIIHIFQPHRYTRTQELFADFVTSLSGQTMLILLPVYAASEEPIARYDSQALAEAIDVNGKADVYLVNDFEEILQILPCLVRDGGIVITQGAGSVGKFIPYLVSRADEFCHKPQLSVESLNACKSE